MAQDALLDISDLRVTFKTLWGRLEVICGVSFQVHQGEIFGLVGESGCGKSVTSLAVLQLLPKSGRVTAGSIRFRGHELLTKSRAEMQKIRGAEIAMIFQDPYTSLNPVFRVGIQLVNVVRQHQPIGKAQAQAKAMEVLAAVGLPDVERIFRAYPHELSGGQQQRVMIAMALVCEPTLLIADEPTTALDVTIQAQILRLLRGLRERLGIAIMLITHDLAVVSETCDFVTVLYAGQVVETAPAAQLFQTPRHPYTRGLIAAHPQPGRKGQPLTAIPGTVPGNPGAIKGCVFHSRCAYTFARCRMEQPPLYQVGARHRSACFLSEEGARV